MAHDVFISYSNKDKETADAVCNILEGKKIRCWIAPRDVPGDIPYPRALVKAIESSRIFVLIYSANANNSEHVFREIDQAAKATKPIIPFRIENVKPNPEIDYYISTRHWLDALTPPIEQHIQKLADMTLNILYPQNISADSAGLKDVTGVIHNDNAYSEGEIPFIPQVRPGSHVYICYSTMDNMVAEAICSHLESKGIKCRIAPRDTPPGINLTEWTMDAIDTSSLILLVLSLNSASSARVIREITSANNHKIPIVVFKTEDIPDSNKFLNYFKFDYRVNATKPQLDKYFDDLSTMVKELLKPETLEAATSISNLARLLAIRGDYAGAKPLYQRALSVRERILGPEHPDTVITINNLAVLLFNKGDYKEAEPLFRRVLNIREKNLGPEHPDVVTTISILANTYYERGDYKEAEPLFRRVLSIQEKILGSEHLDIAQSIQNIAVLLFKKGDVNGAKLLLERAISIRKKISGPEHPDTKLLEASLASLLENKGEYNEAVPRKSLDS